MRKPLWMTLAAALLMSIGTTASAQESSAGAQKPLVTVSFAGYDQLLSNIKVVGDLAGRPELSKGLEGMLIMVTQGKGLTGLDKARPWGLAVYAGEEGKFPVQAFLPVTDLKQVMSLVPNLETGEPYAPDANGVFELKAKGQTLFVAQKGQWAFVVDNRDALKTLSADPSALLGDLSKKYLVAIRASVKNVPAAMRDKFMAQAKMMLDMGMQRQPAESDDQFAIRTNVSKQTFEKFVLLSKELDEAMLGWGLDAKTSAMVLDFEITALPGTQTAKQFAKAKDAKTNFAGFLIPGAALTAVAASEMDDADAAQVKGLLANLRGSASKDLDANEDLTKEQRQLAKQLLGDVLDVLDKTIDTKKSDGGVALLLDSGSPTLVAGAALAGGDKLDKVVKQLVAEVGKEQAELAKMIKLNADSSRRASTSTSPRCRSPMKRPPPCSARRWTSHWESAKEACISERARTRWRRSSR